ncbi:MAG: hypothetical protein WA813_26600 [Beijerinckiaceae bacterium]
MATEIIEVPGLRRNKEEDDMTKTGSRVFRGAAIAGALFVGGFMADVNPSTWQSRGTVVSQAEAVVGRPATPGSVAGVARRSSRRHVRRHYY